MQKNLQLKDIYNLEVSIFMYKYTNSQLQATFKDYFKLITDVHPYTVIQDKSKQQKFVLEESTFKLRS